MKTLKFGTAVASVLFLFNACSKESTVSVQPEEQLSTDYTLVDFDELAAPQVTDGTTEEFKLVNPEKHLDQTPCDRPCDKHDGTGKRDGKDNSAGPDERHDLGGLLKKLNLTQQQKEAIQKFMHEHCMCIAEHLKKTNEINRQIIATFNQKRTELIKAFKDNKITKEEYNHKLAGLKDELIQALKKNNDKDTQIEVMKKCEEQFLHNVASVLDARQAELFKKWLDNHK